MMVGYLPDSFGHPSQMPQILLGLGLREIVFWRGLGPEIDTTEFQWTGFDGSTILGINMPLSYGVGAALPANDEELLDRIEKRCGELMRLTRTRSLLLMNGVDHMAPERNLPARVGRASKRTRLNLRLSTLPEYLDEIRGQLQVADLPRTTGELRSGYRAYLLGGTLSTR
ncbi:MAG: hypothetical protein KAU31_08225, partial [Spirochaetaceae bacterium]|nr:hypothetical protein [Spirochaetaceae bacterium]